jgi:hypothetical protein
MAILELMKDCKIWSNEDIRKKMEHSFNWSDEDRSVASRGEAKWRQRVNNALSQAPDRSQSLYAKGFMETVGHGLHKITAKGISYINEEDFDFDDLLNSI